MKVAGALLSKLILFCQQVACIEPEWFDTNVLVNRSYRWTEGVVPYEMDGSHGFVNEWYIWRAMAVYHRNTCVRFAQRRTSDRDWVHITSKGRGCFSKVGRVGGRQTLNLARAGCTSAGVVLHELMHVIGFLHEHNRPDRDEYVRVYQENILDGAQENFLKLARNVTFEFPYDFDSIMHYGQFTFSKNGNATMRAKGPTTKNGRKDFFSETDLAKIRLVYNCTGYQALSPNSRYVFAGIAFAGTYRMWIP
ncbi:hypothetical protein PPYR_03322 [Photinus pyralis]|uniref:Metalloendopeptidase n=2 Tax=Photinus pyralis TaxID=7054 RepID=A0A5N4A2I9_PHOPY|nr:astacin-like metalloprotease toxin 5 [Photinus pyralis]KAB0791522.1 hypothetical protein PPYR_03322 [Photinus pyralis]